jgi:transposase
VRAFFEKLQPCLVGIEACATSHYWSRELKTLWPGFVPPPPAPYQPA